MGRQPIKKEIHSDDIKIEQKPDIIDDPSKYEGDIVIAQQMPNKDWMNEMAFNDEPVTIRLEPSSDKNAPTSFPIWNNGTGCEVWQGGRWQVITYIPVGRVVTIKRKYLATLIGAKTDTVHTKVQEPESERPNNIIERYTSAVSSFSVIEDKNPRGAEWMQELRRRNF